MAIEYLEILSKKHGDTFLFTFLRYFIHIYEFEGKSLSEQELLEEIGKKHPSILEMIENNISILYTIIDRIKPSYIIEEKNQKILFGSNYSIHNFLTHSFFSQKNLQDLNYGKDLRINILSIMLGYSFTKGWGRKKILLNDSFGEFPWKRFEQQSGEIKRTVQQKVKSKYEIVFNLPLSSMQKKYSDNLYDVFNLSKICYFLKKILVEELGLIIHPSTLRKLIIKHESNDIQECLQRKHTEKILPPHVEKLFTNYSELINNKIKFPNLIENELINCYKNGSLGYLSPLFKIKYESHNDTNDFIKNLEKLLFTDLIDFFTELNQTVSIDKIRIVLNNFEKYSDYEKVFFEKVNATLLNKLNCSKIKLIEKNNSSKGKNLQIDFFDELIERNPNLALITHIKLLNKHILKTLLTKKEEKNLEIYWCLLRKDFKNNGGKIINEYMIIKETPNLKSDFIPSKELIDKVLIILKNPNIESKLNKNLVLARYVERYRKTSIINLTYLKNNDSNLTSTYNRYLIEAMKENDLEFLFYLISKFYEIELININPYSIQLVSLAISYLMPLKNNYLVNNIKSKIIKLFLMELNEIIPFEDDEINESNVILKIILEIQLTNFEKAKKMCELKKDTNPLEFYLYNSLIASLQSKPEKERKFHTEIMNQFKEFENYAYLHILNIEEKLLDPKINPSSILAVATDRSNFDKLYDIKQKRPCLNEQIYPLLSEILITDINPDGLSNLIFDIIRDYDKIENNFKLISILKSSIDKFNLDPFVNAYIKLCLDNQKSLTSNCVKLFNHIGLELHMSSKRLLFNYKNQHKSTHRNLECLEEFLDKPIDNLVLNNIIDVTTEFINSKEYENLAANSSLSNIGI